MKRNPPPGGFHVNEEPHAEIGNLNLLDAQCDVRQRSLDAGTQRQGQALRDRDTFARSATYDVARYNLSASSNRARRDRCEATMALTEAAASNMYITTI